VGADAPGLEPLETVALEADDLEVAPLARVQRSRLAFAVAITLAALPLVVLDNLPATAETNDNRVEVQASAAEESSSSEASTTQATAPSTTTTEAPTTTTAAPDTTTTEVPATTKAPPTTKAPVVQALRAPAPSAPPSTAPPTTAAPSTGHADPNDPATWDRLAQCESHGNWALNTGNGYYGGLQFSLATWQNVGGAGYPHEATRDEQIKRGQILQSRAGWGQWPHCSRQLGYT